ncbi:hypothetical protein PCANC_21564 [Puccinia coronata f. sp. avenae]|uniref:Uncharacterized protein n=1 Tax=Puccinia coronata f. sp. avenae TaxID=200324 RepID=A0A2N5U821_9BASI|nr:hypothetical protein PCANC_21564 [Puccinia coronata f. sp. avenae]
MRNWTIPTVPSLSVGNTHGNLARERSPAPATRYPGGDCTPATERTSATDCTPAAERTPVTERTPAMNARPPVKNTPQPPIASPPPNAKLAA